MTEMHELSFPTPSPSSQAPEVSIQPFACVRCYKRKKKCDKISPACGRCIADKNRCVYSAEPPVRRPSTKPALPFGYDFSSINDDQNNTGSVTPPPEDSSPSSQLSRLLQHSSPFSIQDILTCQVDSFFTELRDEVEEICDRYSKSVNTWFPITMSSQFRQHIFQVKNQSISPKSDIRLLFLCITLVTQMPTKSKGVEYFDHLYSVLKPFYLQIQSSHLPSVEVIQAGLLLSMYEHGQGLHRASYMTIGTCGRTGHAMNLHKTVSQSVPDNPNEFAIYDLHKHTWWSIVIVERMLAIETIKFGHRPMECRDPHLTDSLPSFFGHNERVNNPLGMVTSARASTEFPEIRFPDTNPFGRAAQAAYLSSLVLDWIFSDHEYVDVQRQQAEVMYLSKTIQAFAMSNIAQGEQDTRFEWAAACGANFLTQSTLWALHQVNFNLNPPRRNFSESDNTFSLFTLKSLTRLSNDIVKNVLVENERSPKLITPFTLHTVLSVADFHFRIGPDPGSEDEWRKEMEDRNKYLGIAGLKWKLARYVEADLV